MFNEERLHTAILCGIRLTDKALYRPVGCPDVPVKGVIEMYRLVLRRGGQTAGAGMGRVHLGVPAEVVDGLALLH